jgi:hypothetical protein
MHGYNNVSVRPLLTVHYNGYIEDFMQGYSKVSVGSRHTVPI